MVPCPSTLHGSLPPSEALLQQFQSIEAACSLPPAKLSPNHFHCFLSVHAACSFPAQLSLKLFRPHCMLAPSYRSEALQALPKLFPMVSNPSTPHSSKALLKLFRTVSCPSTPPKGTQAKREPKHRNGFGKNNEKQLQQVTDHYS